MKKIVKNLFFFALLYFSLPLLINSVWAGYLTFDKTTVTVVNGATFQVSVTVNPESDGLNGAETYINYDASLLKATAVSAGVLFPTVTNDISASGKVFIAAYVDDPASSISSTGTIATVTFQALKDGNGTLSYDCDTTKIIKNDVNASNVIVCSQNGTSAVTVGSGSSNNPTAAPNTAPTAAPNGGDIGTLPQTGIFDNVVKFATPGFILLILGGALKLLL